MKLSYRVFALDPDAQSLDPKELYVLAKDVRSEEEAVTEANKLLDAGADTVHITIQRV